MTRYALIKPDNTIDRLATNVDPNVQTKAGFRWILCEPVAPPTFDAATEIVTGPTYTVGADAVTEVWTKRALNAQEISDRKDARISGMDLFFFGLMFDMENRMRTQVESKPALTAAQYRAALKAKLP